MQAEKSRKKEDKHDGDKLWTMQELDWFSKNAYNLALKYSAKWPPEQVLQIIQSCIKFAGIYPKDIDNVTSNDVTHRHIFCDFLAVTFLVSLARAEDNIEAQLQDYLELRKHVDSFDTRLQSIIDVLEEGPQQDLLKKLAALLVFDFEAAIRLKAWDDLTEVILKADCCKSMDIYEKMSDMLLSDPSVPIAGMPVSPPVPPMSYRLTKHLQSSFQRSNASSMKLGPLRPSILSNFRDICAASSDLGLHPAMDR